MTLAYATSEALIDATLEFAIGSDVRSQNSARVRGALYTPVVDFARVPAELGLGHGQPCA